jgi:PadR family transcriptional regulator, regulatory protein PadR
VARKSEYKNRIELVQGTLDMLILQTLQWGPQHGYGIVQHLHTLSGEVLQVETGSLYPALHRLERQGWVRSDWKLTDSNQRARFYQITAAGKKQLASDHDRWRRAVEAIAAVMQKPSGGQP